MFAMNDLIQKLMDDYKNKRLLYEEFSRVVCNLLDSMLKEKKYKYQIYSRTKEIERLQEKLIRKEREGVTFADLSEIKDLAGVRVVFYLESDKKQFVKDIYNEISGELNVEEKRKDSGYTADHVIISLGPKRLQLSEYKKYENLKCEIQLTSMLYHAWAEIEHDLIYKDLQGLKTNNSRRFKKIEKRLNKILKKHILKAIDEFEKITRHIKGK
jgi:ppGpp synthetase/RelA/SpoT-type nucleotidyltranferase